MQLWRSEEVTVSGATAEVSIDIRASRQRVWRALTDPDLVQQYFMGARVDTDWQPGSPITFSGEWDGRAFQDKGEVLEFQPGQRLSYSHWSPLSGAPDTQENYHVVTVALSGPDDRTEVRLTQSNLSGEVTEADRASRAQFESNWNQVLNGLKKTAES
jgi:uncharacterized protein YndB with AHSA1/START domain